MGGASELEVELKLMLSGAAASERVERALLSRGAKCGQAVRQVNHFFDTDAASLRAVKTTLRLREEGQRFELTAKGPARVEGDVHRRVELEIELEPELARSLLAGEGAPLELLAARFGREHALLEAARTALADQHLLEVGSFENERRRVGPLALGSVSVHFELDRTQLPGGRLEHELELEFPAGLEREAQELVQGILREADAEGTPAKSKAARFFALLAAGGA